MSVIVPALNAQDYIAEMLAGLARQDYEGDWEVVIADNGCTDRTLEIAESWRDKLPELRVVDATGRRGAAHARNVASDAARGEFLACLDADNVPATGWLRGLVEAGGEADLVRAEEDRVLLNAGLPEGWPPVGRPKAMRETGWGSVAGSRLGVWRDVAREVRWDESLRGGEDVDFSFRARRAGMTVVTSEQAVIHKRLRRSLSALARQGFWYGYALNLLRARYGPQEVRSREPTGRWGECLGWLSAARRSRAARSRLLWGAAFAAGSAACRPAARRERRRIERAGEAREPATP